MDESTVNIIETRNLTKIYGNSYIALNGANLSVPRGTVFGLVGPNGAGKTTTIRLLLGLHQPTAGTIKVFGEPMTLNATRLRQRIGFLPTNPHFPRDMNPITYLDFVGKLFGLPAEIRKPRLSALLRAVGLLSAASQRIKGFSTGMVTRLGIAASLMNDPELLIWDEPTSGLDPEGRKYTIDLIQELGRRKTILVSSHNLADIRQVCDHIGVLSEGKLIFNGSLQDMKQLVPPNTITLELSGPLDGLAMRLPEPTAHVEWSLEGRNLMITFADRKDLARPLAAILQTIAEAEVQLAAINTLNDDMVHTFIHLLEEERAHGFSRILRMEPADDALPRANGG